ncbi:hypothetical protein PTTG_28091 [Puccinia triticina 1-1 BBBD Race 1]|uniref:Uncharacterized protein n=1 Tax=Puccinia triticina (isolate 1-1 / race 1 (BBBD)) TaxID=630390 RepID=A0A180GFH4_PUCT1|nr:hypothetical protein PTTG_28091 [Puccinia triticina 1-1 BBBD Race 1]
MPTIQSLPWSSDGHEGGPPSMTVLIDWLTTGNNYLHWHTSESQESKRALCRDILEELAAKGIHHCDVHGIYLMIRFLEQSYKEAAEFRRNAEGSPWGLDPRGRVVSVESHTRRICRHWDRLDPILAPYEPIIVDSD